MNRALTAADGSFPRAKAMIARIVVARFNQTPGDLSGRDEAIELAREAIAEGSDDATTLRIAADALCYLSHAYDVGLAAAQRAVELNPNSAQTLYSGGSIHYYAGQDENAVRLIERAIELSPIDPEMHLFQQMLAWANLALGRFDTALKLAKSAMVTDPAGFAGRRVACAALALLGNMKEAAAAAEQLLKISPDFRLSTYPFPRVRDEAREQLIGALRAAGIPD